MLKKGGKFSRDEIWWLVGEVMQVVKGIKYLGVVLDSGGKWEEEKTGSN